MQRLSVFGILLAFGLIGNAEKLIKLRLDAKNGRFADECVTTAAAALRNETCIDFGISRSQAAAADVISVVESGYCSYQEANRTIHLGKNCANEEMCSLLIAMAATGERPYHGVARHLNLKYNCSNKCTILCENGATPTADCKCKCAYGFDGPHCENLSLKPFYTDSSCGNISSSEYDGTLQLSTYPKPAPKSTFCQWFIKTQNPAESVEFEFVELDLNSIDALPTQRCADSLLVSGVKGIDSLIPCDNQAKSIVGRRYRSQGDWLLITLSTTSVSTQQHKGPLIKYRIISPQSNKEIRSFADPFENSASNSASFAFFLLIAIALIVRH